MYHDEDHVSLSPSALTRRYLPCSCTSLSPMIFGVFSPVTPVLFSKLAGLLQRLCDSYNSFWITLILRLTQSGLSPPITRASPGIKGPGSSDNPWVLCAIDGDRDY